MPKRRARTVRRRRPVRRRARRAAPVRRRAAPRRRAPARKVRRRARKNPTMFANPTVKTVLAVGGGYVGAQFIDAQPMIAEQFSRLPLPAAIAQPSTAIGLACVGIGLFTKIGNAKTRRTLVAVGGGMLLKPAGDLVMQQLSGVTTSQISKIQAQRLPPPRSTSKRFIAASKGVNETDYA